MKTVKLALILVLFSCSSQSNDKESVKKLEPIRVIFENGQEGAVSSENSQAMLSHYTNRKLDSLEWVLARSSQLDQISFLLEIGFLQNDGLIQYSKLNHLTSNAVKHLYNNAGQQDRTLGLAFVIVGTGLNDKTEQNDYLNSVVFKDEPTTIGVLKLFSDLYKTNPDQVVNTALITVLERSDLDLINSWLREIGYLNKTGSRASRNENALKHLSKSAILAILEKYQESILSRVKYLAIIQSLKELTEKSD